MNTYRNERDPFGAFFGRGESIARGPRATQPREHVSSRVWSPGVDVLEDANNIVIQADLPGMNQDEIDIEVTDDSLTIKGERKFPAEANRDQYIRVERQYGAFQRSFTIGVPIEAEQIKATYRNGILELTIPKAEITRPKKVPVTGE